MRRTPHGSGRPISNVVWAVVWFCVVVGIAGSAWGQATTGPGKVLLMHYMPWYQTAEVRGAWGGHWAGFDRSHRPEKLDDKGRPDIWSHYHPLIGLYDSTDSAAVECQLLQMKLAGVDGVIADWYGISDVADYPANQQGTQVLFEQTARCGMMFAACFEDRTYRTMVEQGKLRPDQVAGHLAGTIRWMQEHWFERTNYFRIGGRPVLLDFGPEYILNPMDWRTALGSVPSRPALYALPHVWKKVDADGAFAWVYPEVWRGEPSRDEITQRLQRAMASTSEDSQKLIASACPGFNDVYEKHYEAIPHRDGETLRESLELAMAGPWPIVQLVTWNDYGEGTMIEPTQEFGYRFLEIVQASNQRGRGWKAEDIRLPARLYAMRKSGRLSASAADEIAAMLGMGECDGARRLIEAGERR